MKEYNIEVLKDAANRLLFDMSENEYQTLLQEFDIVTKQMEIIGKNPQLDSYDPMVYPFDCDTTIMRDDVPDTPLTKEESLRNSSRKVGGQIKLPRVIQ